MLRWQGGLRMAEGPRWRPGGKEVSEEPRVRSSTVFVKPQASNQTLRGLPVRKLQRMICIALLCLFLLQSFTESYVEIMCILELVKNTVGISSQIKPNTLSPGSGNSRNQRAHSQWCHDRLAHLFSASSRLSAKQSCQASE